MRWAAPAAAVLFVLAALSNAQTLAHYRTAANGMRLPDSAVTPGVIAITDATKVCGIVWGRDARHVTEAMKIQVCRGYGIVSGCPGPAWEIDHLISRELGGADDTKNLWPQCATRASCAALHQSSALHQLPTAPTFLHHIARIVFESSQEQMRWINAMAHVARVENVETIRDRTVRQFPRDTMRPRPSVGHPAYANNGIALVTDSRLPQPTPSSFLDLSPKPLFDRNERRTPSAHRLYLTAIEVGSEAHLKDRVENFLHRQVCGGMLTLKAAQEMIRADWTVPLMSMPK